MKQKQNIFIILILAFWLCSFVGVGYFSYQDYLLKNANNEIKGNQSEETSTKLSNGQLAIKINSFLDFENASVYTKAGIKNKEENIYDLYVTIELKDTKEEIFHSSILHPCESIEQLKLNKNLKPGTYSAIAYFNAVDQKENYLGKAGAKVKIMIHS